MAESNGNGNGNGRQMSPQRAEYEAATKELRFSKDFFPALEAIINDPLETIGTRVLAWYKRHSWGNFSLYAVNDDGSDAQQTDCASALGVTKQRVCQAVNYNEKRGYLYRDGKKVYVSISPSLGPKPSKVARSADFSAFLEEWKVAHSADFQELEVARAAVERIRKVILSGYRESRRARTNGGALNKEEILESTEREEYGVVSSSSALENPPPETTTIPTPPEEQTPPDEWQDVHDYIRQQDFTADERQINGFVGDCRKARPGLKPDFLLRLLTDWRVGPKAVSRFAIWKTRIPPFLRSDARLEAWNNRPQQTNGGFTYAFAPHAEDSDD